MAPRWLQNGGWSPEEPTIWLRVEAEQARLLGREGLKFSFSHLDRNFINYAHMGKPSEASALRLSGAAWQATGPDSTRGGGCTEALGAGPSQSSPYTPFTWLFLSCILY